VNDQGPSTNDQTNTKSKIQRRAVARDFTHWYF
jgi:hypothetical protein